MMFPLKDRVEDADRVLLPWMAATGYVRKKGQMVRAEIP